MNKTLSALDELLSSIITLVPTWLSMLKSTRVLTLVGTGAIMYFTATQGGLTEFQTVAVQAAEAVLGISFIGFKTIRSDNGTVTVTEPKPVEPMVVEPKPTTTIPVDYAIPFNVKEYATNGATAFLKWEGFEDIYSQLDLTNFNPNIRTEFADQILNEGKRRLDAAWNEEMKNEKADPVIKPPDEDQFDSYDATEMYKKTIMDSIPGCAWIPQNISQLFKGYNKWYTMSNAMDDLYGKDIDWENAYSLFLIGAKGLSAAK